jgi:hypothetical protein
MKHLNNSLDNFFNNMKHKHRKKINHMMKLIKLFLKVNNITSKKRDCI